VVIAVDGEPLEGRWLAQVYIYLSILSVFISTYK